MEYSVPCHQQQKKKKSKSALGTVLGSDNGLWGDGAAAPQSECLPTFAVVF